MQKPKTLCAGWISLLFLGGCTGYIQESKSATPPRSVDPQVISVLAEVDLSDPEAIEANRAELRPAFTKGAELYSAHCRSCHRALPLSTKKGRQLSNIDFGIANIDDMKALQLPRESRLMIALALNWNQYDKPDACTSAASLARSPVRLLSPYELKHSLEDSLGLVANLEEAGLHASVSNAGTLDKVSSGSAFDSKILEKLLDYSFSAAGRAVASGAATHLQCSDGSLFPANKCYREVLDTVGALAFKGAAQPELVDKAFAKVQEALTHGFSDREALSYGFAYMLTHPRFLFLNLGNKLDGNSGNGLAERLSYLLWQSLPDGKLLAAAKDGRLNNAEDLRAEVRRMAADRKMERFHSEFTINWLGLGAIRQRLAYKDRTYFDFGYSDELTEGIVKEPMHLLQAAYAAKEDLRYIATTLDGYANRPLGKHYGVPVAEAGATFSKIQSQSPGIFTKVASMSVSSDASHTIIPRRGKYFIENILCLPSRPVPANVTQPVVNSNFSESQVRLEEMRIRAGNPACFGCHAQMDPVGLGFESFDQFGLFRTTYDKDGSPVLTDSRIYGQNFSGTRELTERIADSREYHYCVSQKLLEFSIGRDLTAADQCAAWDLGEKSFSQGLSVEQLLLEAIQNPLFKDQE